MKLLTATSLLLCMSAGLADQCAQQCDLGYIYTPCVEACQSGGKLCDDFCTDYISDVETCKALFCQGHRFDVI
eukprot:scaffold57386_cov66-Cyclotella_meneghiniana.AAC.12